MRDHVEGFIRGGGNVAFFSGNTCWRQVRLTEDGTVLECNKKNGAAYWWSGVGRPENSLTGVSSRNAGAWWGGPREALGFTVQHCDSWVFEGTKLKNGQVIGKDEHLVGFECDGAALAETPSARKLVLPNYKDGTPRSFCVLGWAILSKLGDGDDGWSKESRENDSLVRASTMGIYTNNGSVFTASTTDWARVLTKGEDHHVPQITHNILKTLSLPLHQKVAFRRHFHLILAATPPVFLASLLMYGAIVPVTRRQLMFGFTGVTLLSFCGKKSTDCTE
jgi:hypothetical protein